MMKDCQQEKREGLLNIKNIEEKQDRKLSQH